MTVIHAKTSDRRKECTSLKIIVLTIIAVIVARNQATGNATTNCRAAIPGGIVTYDINLSVMYFMLAQIAALDSYILQSFSIILFHRRVEGREKKQC